MRSFVLALGAVTLVSFASVAACGSDGTVPAMGEPDASAPGRDGSNGSSGNPITNPDGSSGPVANVTTSAHTMRFDGETRTYLLAKPTNYDPKKAYPLVFSFHGNPSSETIQADILPFDVASGRDAVIVYPRALQGDGNVYDWDLSISEGNLDMDWIVALVGELDKTLNLDRERIFGFGYSGGAFFVANMTCRSGGFFKAISVNAGGAPFVPDDVEFPKHSNDCLVCPGGPVATLVTHGDQDTEVGEWGGVENANCAATTNECGGRKPSTPKPCETYEGCPTGSEVKLCNIPGWGHAPWEKAVTESWAFFKAHF